jgi:hypothetical protein
MATAANVVKLKRSAVAGRVPATTDLALGEIALNTYDGRVYLKKSVSAVESIVTLEQLPTNLRGYTFPVTQGDLGQVLTTNGDGTLSWATVSGGGGPSYSVNYTSQSLNASQQAQARSNIDAISTGDAFIFSLIF